MLNFFRARSNDPITSFKAADSIKETAKMHGELIVACLRSLGPMGKDGIAKYTGLEGNQVARRLKELQTSGFIMPTGREVKSNSNRSEREWCFVPAQGKLI
jgi:hypothetical protein